MKFLRIIIGLLAILVFGLLLLRILGPILSKPASLGVENGRLTPCPNKPNCVSTFATDAEHKMEAWEYEGETAVVQQTLIEIINQMSNANIVTDRPGYIHAEFSSPSFHFIDDVEFLFDEENNLIHFRSASRLGYDDLEANPQRMNEIKEAFDNA